MTLYVVPRCPTCGARADQCFAHGTEWKRPARYQDTRLSALQRMTDYELREAVHEFTQDDPPPYGRTA